MKRRNLLLERLGKLQMLPFFNKERKEIKIVKRELKMLDIRDRVLKLIKMIEKLPNETDTEILENELEMLVKKLVKLG